MFVVWRSDKTTKFYVRVSLSRLKQSLTILSSLPNKMCQSQLFIFCDSEHWLSGKKFPFYSPSDHQVSGQRRLGVGGFISSPRNWNFSWTSSTLQKLRCVPEGYCLFSYTSWIHVDFDVTLSMIVLKEVIWILSFGETDRQTDRGW